MGSLSAIRGFGRSGRRFPPPRLAPLESSSADGAPAECSPRGSGACRRVGLPHRSVSLAHRGITGAPVPIVSASDRMRAPVSASTSGRSTYGVRNLVGILVLVAACGNVTATSGGGGAGSAGSAGAASAKDAGPEHAGSTGSGGTTIVDAADGVPARPLGAGCSADTDCGSGICDLNGSHACCDGRPDACNTCVGGYKTPVQNGSVECGVCEGGTLIPLQDGTACGTSECEGTPQPTGQEPLPPAGIACLGSDAKSYSTDCYYPTATNSTCRAGVCLAASTDCSTVACPANCTKKYVGCYLNYNGNAANGARCYCVDTNYQICS